MSSYDILQNNFPSGELSPLWKGKSNSEFYRTGLDTCKNFMPMTPSGLRRRPGTKYLMETVNQALSIIVPMTVDSNSLVCEITKGKARVWDVSDPSNATTASDAKLNFTDDLENIRYCVNKGVIWLVNALMKPVTVTVSGSYPFTITVAEPTFSGDVTFSSSGDYPSCVGFKGGRLLFGGTKNLPNAIFASRSPDYTAVNPDRYTDFNFLDGGLVIASCALEVEDNELSQARWFLNSQRFLVGSSTIIFSDNGVVITPTDFDISPTLREGSANIPAKGLKNYVVYAGVSGKTMHIMVYDSDSEQYVSKSITTNSSHLFSAGIKDFAITFMPDPIIWVLLNDGTMLSCTIDNSSGSFMTGWAKHTFTDRTPCNLASVPGEDGRDILYIVMQTESSYHIETLEMDDIFDESESKVYLDMRISRSSGSPTDTFAYTTLMAGKTVSVIADGAILPEVVVDDSGNVTLDREVSDCEIGLSFESLAAFLSQEQPTNGQSSFGNKRRLKSVTLRVYQSFGGFVGLQHDDTSKMRELLSSKYGTHEYGETISLVDEDFVADIQSPNITNATLYVLSDYPTPLNILALKEKIELLET